jgi:hypothetical protein
VGAAFAGYRINARIFHGARASYRRSCTHEETAIAHVLVVETKLTSQASSNRTGTGGTPKSTLPRRAQALDFVAKSARSPHSRSQPAGPRWPEVCRILRLVGDATIPIIRVRAWRVIACWGSIWAPTTPDQTSPRELARAFAPCCAEGRGTCLVVALSRLAPGGGFRCGRRDGRRCARQTHAASSSS